MPPTAAAAAHVTASPPLALYVHLPWCLRKCPYCDFNSHELRGVAALTRAAELQYTQALRADLEAALPMIWGRTVQTVFFGGGTPSLFSAQAIDDLLVMIRSLTRLAADAEITLEANPGTFERNKFRDFRAAGVNRLSIGVQSFNDVSLLALGRVHNASEAMAAIELAATCYDSFNIDLMYGLPGQSLSDLDAELQRLASIGPPHLSYYNLTLEPNTYFAKFPPALPDDDCIAQMQDLVFERSAALGLAHYEVSAYARAGHRAQHNLNYWQFGDYLGIGAGAHSKLSFHDRILRQAKYRQPAKYQEAALAGMAVQEQRQLSNADAAFEFMLNALRLREGVAEDLFVERTGLPISFLSKPIAQALNKGLLEPQPGRLRASDLGFRFLNDLQGLFLADA